MIEMAARPVALFSPTLGGGGAEKILINLACGMTSQGDAVDIVLSQATGKNLEQIPTRARLVDLHAHRTASSLHALARYIRERRPRAIICFQDHATVIALWARTLAGVPTPLVGTVHNTWSRLLANGKFKTRVLARCARHAYRKVESVVAVSEGAADDLAATLRLSREKITVIYNPVITPEMFQKSKESVEHPWFAPGCPPVILGIGRLTRQKDFPNLLQAFAQARREMPCRLMVLGDGEDRDALTTLAASTGFVEDIALPGYAENPYKYLANAAVFVLSSLWEGLPTVLIEALALGIPVIATNCESGPREILQDGLYGELVPTADSPALAAAIEYTLLHKRARPAETRRFHAAEVTEQYRSLVAAIGQ
jgi:glycosyltransferase involved in cell wall biosynthesis